MQFIANGIVFVLLGEQLPAVLANAQASVTQTGHHSLWWPLMLIAAIYSAMLTLRLFWVAASMILSRPAAGPDPLSAWRLVAATALAGSRGAITFAGILTLPVTLVAGAAFAGRDLIILITMGVIVLSLITPAIGLPLLLKSGAALPSPVASEETAARTASATAAVAEIARISALHATDDKKSEIYAAAAARISRQYLQRLEVISRQSDGQPAVHPETRILQELHLAAVRAERGSVFLMRRQKQIGAAMARKLVRELDLLEAHYET